MSLHVQARMVDRAFSETDLRILLGSAFRVERTPKKGRWVAHSRYLGRHWEVGLEPDFEQAQLVVVTAYPIDR